MRGEIPCRKVYEDDDVLAFHDIQPQAAGAFHDHPEEARGEPVRRHRRRRAGPGQDPDHRGQLAREQGANDGFRTIINTGRIGQQEVQHVHVHVIAGAEPLGRMIPRKSS